MKSVQYVQWIHNTVLNATLFTGEHKKIEGRVELLNLCLKRIDNVHTTYM